MTQLLFSYGTFKDSNVQKSIFNREVSTKPAYLEGYSICADKDGYYYLNETQGTENKVNGLVLELSQRELWLADQWEEVPLYERERVQVHTSSGIETVWVYFKNNTEFSHYVSGDDISNLSEEDLEEELNSFCKERRLDMPILDYYLLYPFILKDRSKYANINECKDCFENIFVSKIIEDYKEEFSDKSLNNIKYKYLGKIRITINNYFISAYVYGTINEEIGIGIMTISIPVCYSSIISIFEAAVNSSLKTEDNIEISDYVTKFGFNLSSRPMCYVFSTDMLNEKFIRRLLEVEKYLTDTHYNKKFRDKLLSNIDQHRNPKIYFSKYFLLEAPIEFGDRYKDRISHETLTLSIVEKLLLEEIATMKS